MDPSYLYLDLEWSYIRIAIKAKEMCLGRNIKMKDKIDKTWDGPRNRIFWMTVVISKVNVAGQVLFGWRLDFLTLFDHYLLVSLIDTIPPLFKCYPCFAPIFPFNLICSWHQVWPPRAGQWDGWVCSCLEEYFHVTIYQRCDSKSICQLQTQWSQWARRR